jgi:hypothetical protein
VTDERLKALSEDQLRGLAWRLEVLEGRREEADRFAWAVPGLTIAGQAFLLSIALDPGTRPLARLLAAVAGLVTLGATAHLLAKQAYNFDVFEAVIERDRKRLGLPGVQMDALVVNPASPPANTSYRRRRWSDRRTLRHWLVVRFKAMFVWAIALLSWLASTSGSSFT